MAALERMSLMDLADQELLHIASLLQQPIDESHLPAEAVFTPPTTDLVHLSTVSSRARRLLSPLVFQSMVLGEVERSRGYARELKELRKMDMVLCHVKHVLMLDIHRKSIKPLVQVLSNMVNLRYYTHGASVPILLPVAHLLRTRFPTFEGLLLPRFAAESLPSLNSDHLLGGMLQLRVISVNTGVEKPTFRDLHSSAPITVSANRRVGCCGKVVHGPTLEEHTTALVEGLGRLILASRETLETLEVERGGALTDTRLFEQLFDYMHENEGGKKYSVLPRLRRLSLRNADCDSPALQHLLATSPQLTDLCFSERIPKCIDPPKAALRNLRSFHYSFIMDLSVSHTVKGFIDASSHLNDLQLQGLHTKETRELFHSRQPYSSIRILNLAFAGGALSRQNLLTICGACPNVVDLVITALRWRCTWSHLVKVLAIGLTELETLDTDLPIVSRGVPTSSGGGDGIRSRSAGDFRLLSALAGRLSDEEVLDMINTDITAVRPFYLEKIAELASSCPALRCVVLRPTSEVIWHLSITRDADGEVEMDDEPLVSLVR